VTSFGRKYDTISRSCRKLVGLVLAVSFLAGCQPTIKDGSPKPVGLPKPVAHADRIGLYVPEAAVANWDDRPGPDGVRAQVILYRDEPGGKFKSVLVTGKIDLMLYEGAQPANLSGAGTPFRSWTFNKSELARLTIGQYGVLWGYSMLLEWGREVPKSEKIWMIARYRSPTGQAIYSSPVERPMPTE